MGFIGRIKSVFSGFLGKTADRIEAKNPQLLISDAEQKIQKSRRAAQKQLVDIQTWAEMVRMDMKEAELRLSDVQVKIDMAAKDRDKKLLTELFIMEEELTAELEEKRSLHKSAVDEAIKVRDNYKQFEADMNSRLRELSAIRTQSEIVEMREKIAGIDYSYGSAQDDKINNIRRSLNERCARVTAMQQLKESATDTGIRRIADKMAFQRAEAKADAILMKNGNNYENEEKGKNWKNENDENYENNKNNKDSEDVKTALYSSSLSPSNSSSYAPSYSSVISPVIS